jgi:hypothetical protein
MLLAAASAAATALLTVGHTDEPLTYKYTDSINAMSVCAYNVLQHA